MSSSYSIGVLSPCTGTQVVSQQGTNVYAGSAGDFTYALLNLPSGASRWRLTTFDYEQGTTCEEEMKFEQNAPGNASDPTGDYTEIGGSGTAHVATYP